MKELVIISGERGVEAEWEGVTAWKQAMEWLDEAEQNSIAECMSPQEFLIEVYDIHPDSTPSKTAEETRTIPNKYRASFSADVERNSEG